MIRFVKPPFDPPKPNDLAGQLAEAIRIAAADLASKKETELGHVITGCDGFPVVTIGDGTTCHDGAKANSGGALALTANLGGCRAVINANLGRSQSMNSGYQGTGLSSGAIPPAMDAGAADVSLDPIDSTLAVAINAGDSADPLSDFVGATISGKTGDSKRLAICYEAGGAAIWDDVLIGSETAITGLSIDPSYISALGNGKYALTELYSNTVSFVDAGAETSTSNLPNYPGVGTPCIAYSAVAASRDLDTMALVVVSGAEATDKIGICIGTSMLTTPSWAVLDTDAVCDFQVYGLRDLLFDNDGNLWAAGQTPATGVPLILFVEPPYSGVSQILTPSWSGGSATYNDPVPLAISRDGRYVASGVNVNLTLVDIWQVSSRTRIRTLSIPSGYTNELGPGGLCFGPDGRLFGLIQRTSDSMYCVAVWVPPFSLSPEIIPLPTSGIVDGWMTVSGDAQCLAVQVNYDVDTDSCCLVQPPFTAGGATVSGLYPTAKATTQFEFDPSEAYVDASGLTLDCTVTSTTGSGSAVTVVTRLSYANTSGTAAFGVIIEMTLPDGSTFTSATDDGLYDSEAGIIRWLIPSVAASGTGYVEVTTSVG